MATGLDFLTKYLQNKGTTDNVDNADNSTEYRRAIEADPLADTADLMEKVDADAEANREQSPVVEQQATDKTQETTDKTQSNGFVATAADRSGAFSNPSERDEAKDITTFANKVNTDAETYKQPVAGASADKPITNIPTTAGTETGAADAETDKALHDIYPELKKAGLEIADEDSLKNLAKTPGGVEYINGLIDLAEPRQTAPQSQGGFDKSKYDHKVIYHYNDNNGEITSIEDVYTNDGGKTVYNDKGEQVTYSENGDKKAFPKFSQEEELSKRVATVYDRFEQAMAMNGADKDTEKAKNTLWSMMQGKRPFDLSRYEEGAEESLKDAAWNLYLQQRLNKNPEERIKKEAFDKKYEMGNLMQASADSHPDAQYYVQADPYNANSALLTTNVNMPAVKTADYFNTEARWRIEAAEGERKRDKGFLSGLTGLGTGIVHGLRSGLHSGFGFNEADKMAHVFAASKRLQQGKNTKDDDMVLDAYVNYCESEIFDKYKGYCYTLGEGAAVSIPYMLEFYYNPLSSAGKAAIKGMTRKLASRYGSEWVRQNLKTLGDRKLRALAERALRESVGSLVKKTTGKTIGKKATKAITYAVDLGAYGAASTLSAGLMTVTTGSGRTYADYVKRQLNDGDTASEAARKAFLSGVNEYGSEFAGPLFKPVFKGMGKAISYIPKKLVGEERLLAIGKALGKTAPVAVTRELITDISNSGGGKMMRDFAKKAHWDGFFEEDAEEVFGSFMNAFTVGDQHFLDENGKPDFKGENSFFNVKERIDEAVNVGFTTLMLGLPAVASYRTPKYRMSQAVKTYDALCSDAFGENWQAFKSTIDACKPEQISSVIVGCMQAGANAKQVNALTKYAVYKARLDAAVELEQGNRFDENSDQDEVATEEAYDNGYTLEGQQRNDAKNRLEDAEKTAAGVLNLENESDVQSAIGLNDDNSNAVEVVKDINQRDDLNDDTKQKVTEYVNARVAMQGTIDAAKDDIDTQIQISDQRIDNQADEEGMVRTAQLKNGTAVYIRNGNVTTDDKGEVITSESDNTLVVQDQVTGELQMVPASDVLQVTSVASADQLKTEAANAIRMETAQKHAQEIDGTLPFNVGDVYNMEDKDGKPLQVEVVADLGNGNVSVNWNGTNVSVPASQIQTLNDDYNRKRLTVWKASREQTDGSGKATEQQSPLAQIPVDENGVRQYTQAAPVTSYDALVEATGSAEGAQQVIDAEREKAKKALEQVKRAKPQGNTTDEIVESARQLSIAKQEAEAVYRYWDTVSRVPAYREQKQRYEAAQASFKRKKDISKAVSEAVAVSQMQEQSAEAARFNELASQIETLEGEEKKKVLDEMSQLIATFAKENGYDPVVAPTFEEFLDIDALAPQRRNIETVVSAGEKVVGFYYRGKIYLNVEHMTPNKSMSAFDVMASTLVHESVHEDNDTREGKKLLSITADAIRGGQIGIQESLDIIEAVSGSRNYARQAAEMAKRGKDPTEMIADELMAHMVQAMSWGVPVESLTNNETLTNIINSAYEYRERVRSGRADVSQRSEVVHAASEGIGRPGTGTDGERESGEHGRSDTVAGTEEEGEVKTEEVPSDDSVETAEELPVEDFYKSKPSILEKWSVDGSTTISPANEQQPADTENISALDQSSGGKVTNNQSEKQEKGEENLQGKFPEEYEVKYSFIGENGAETADHAEEVTTPIQSENEMQTTEGVARFSLLRKTEVDSKSKGYFDSHKTDVSEDVFEKAQRDMDEMGSLMRPLYDATARGNRLLPLEMYEDGGAKSTLFKNGSYGRTIENTLKCIRTLAYNQFCDDVKTALGRPLTQRESFLASQMVYDIATDPQCLYCYVSLDRKAYDEFLLKYIDQRDKLLQKYNSLPKSQKKIGKDSPHTALKSLYAEFLDGRKDTEPMQKRFDNWIFSAMSGDAMITKADLTTKAVRNAILNGFDKSLASQMKDAEKYAQSASWAKKDIDYISYTGEILRLSPTVTKQLMKEYGLRFYSFSEYTPAFILENMQMVRDAALRKLVALAYTKEMDFVKIFAPTGMNINASCYGRRDAEGNMVADTQQGADWEEVKALREKYPNVASVFVATNDKDVEWALEQDWVDIIIPFHIVRTGSDIAEFYNWTNYSGEQADKKKGSSGSMYISPVEHHNNKEMFLKACEEHGVEPRFKKWVNHPNYMRLVNETRLGVDDVQKVQPVFDMDAAKDSWNRFVNRGGYYNGWWRVGDEEYEKAVQQVVKDVQEGKEANAVDYGRQDFPIDPVRMINLARKKKQHGNVPLIDVYDQKGNTLLKAVDTAKFSFIGEKGAANADHDEEVTTRLDNLAVAREMEEAKKDAKAIKMATGWERGADGKWRYEIPDFTIKAPEEWIKKKELKLSDVIDGDNDIFKAYPEAKDIVFKKGRSKSGGWYNDGVIEVGLGDLREAMRWHPGVGVEFEKKWIRRTLLHEVQHYIQEKEGFAQGGNSNMTIDPTFDEKMQQIVAEEKQVLDEWKALPSSEKETPSRMSPRAAEIYRRYNDVQARGNALRKNAKIGKDGYHHLAGEVESRNVEDRANMTEEQRRASLASETEDVAREDQIFLFGKGGESHMGTRTNKHMAEIGIHYEGKTLTDEEQAIVDVFSGKQDRPVVTFTGKDGKGHQMVMIQGQDFKAGSRHAIYRHYGEKVGWFDAGEIPYILDVVKNGKEEREMRGRTRLNVYQLEKDGVKYTVLTEVKKGKEIFNNFYTNRKASSFGTSNTPEEAHTSNDNAISGANVANSSDTANNSGENLQGEGRFSITRATDGTYTVDGEKGLRPLYKTTEKLPEKLNDGKYLTNYNRYADIVRNMGLNTAARWQRNNPARLPYRDIFETPSLEDYYADTRAEFEGVDLKGRSADEVWNEMKDSGKYAWHKSPKSDSEYLVDTKAGDICRKADHWGRVASCAWKLDGYDNVADADGYAIAHANIKDFKPIRNERNTVDNPHTDEFMHEIRQSIVNYTDALENIPMTDKARSWMTEARDRMIDLLDWVKKNNSTNRQVRLSVVNANAKFNEELDEFKNKTHKGLLHLGEPSPILKACGVNVDEITLSPSVLHTHLKKHNLTTDDLKGLVVSMQRPMLVYKHGEHSPNIVIVTELDVKGGKLSVSLELDANGEVLEVSNISSIHSKDAETELKRLYQLGEEKFRNSLRWAEKEKVLHWIAPSSYKPSGMQGNEAPFDIAKVIQDFVNPKVEEDNLQGEGRFSTVYHGSGADFDAFDHSHMGEGEGAQAYGWGTYVTEVEGIGRTYAESSAKRPETIYKYKGKSQSELSQSAEESSAATVITYLKKFGDFEKAKAAYLKSSDSLIRSCKDDGVREELEAKRQAAEALKESDFQKIETPAGQRYLYTIDIPDDNGSNYLEWTKEYSVDDVDSIIGRLLDVAAAKEKEGNLDEYEKFRDAADHIGEWVYGDLANDFFDKLTGENIYRKIAGSFADYSESEASNLLSDAGFVGIKYPAQNRTGGRKDGAKNYVIFKESDAKIEDKLRFSVVNANAKFNDALEEQINGNLPKGYIYKLGEPSSALKFAGVSALPIELASSTLETKSSSEYKSNHPFNLERIKNLPIAIQRPIAVFDSEYEDERKVILTELKDDNGNPIIAVLAIHKSKERNVAEVNSVISLYGKESAVRIAKWFDSTNKNGLGLDKELCKWADTKKASEWLVSNASDVHSAGLSSRRIAKVINSFENYQFKDENIADTPKFSITSATDFANDISEKGLGGVLGKEAVERFADNLYINNADIRREINKGIAEAGFDYKKATRNWFGKIASGDVTPKQWHDIRTAFQKMLRDNGINAQLSDGDVAYALWKETNPGNDILTQAKDISKQMDLGAGRFSVVAPNAGMALDEYNRRALSKKLDWQEAWQDAMISVKALQDSVAMETGTPISDSEDVYHAENRMYGAGKNEAEFYMDNYMEPLLNEVDDVLQEAKRKRVNLDYNGLNDYLMAKHGIERNSFFALKSMLDEAQKAEADAVTARLKAKAEQDYQDALNAARQLTDPLDMLKAVKKANSAKRKADAQAERTGIEEGRQLRDQLYDGYVNDPDLAQLRDQYRRKDIDFRQFETLKRGIMEKHFPGVTQRIVEQGDKAGLSNVMEDDADYENLAFDFVTGLERTLEMRYLWEKINAATEATLKKSYESGKMTKKAYDYVSGMFDFYVPLRGWDETTADEVYEYENASRPVFTPSVKKMFGRKSKAENPIAYIGNMAVSEISSGNKNLMKQYLLRLAQNHPTSAMSVSEVWYENIGTSTNEQWVEVAPNIKEGMSGADITAEMERFNNDMEQKRQQGLAKRQREHLSVGMPILPMQEQEHRVDVMVDGKKYSIFINGSPKAAQAINGTNKAEVNFHLGDRTLQKANRFVSEVLTSKNPAFIPANFMRDMLGAHSQIWIKENAAYIMDFEKNVAKVLLTPRKGGAVGVTGYMPQLLRKWKKGTLDDNNEIERYFKEFMTNGGETGYVNILGVEEFKNDIAKKLNNFHGHAGKNAWHAVWDTVEFYNRAVEDTTRFITYMTSRQQGRSVDRSIDDCKTISLNFNRKGSGKKGNALLRKLVIFVNPAIQALDNQFKLISSHPARFAGMIAFLIMRGMAQSKLNELLISLFGDDDDKDTYYSIPEWTRRNNFVMWIPGTHNWFKIPLSQEFRLWHGLGETMQGVIDGRTKSNPALELTTSMLALLPVDPTGNGGNPIANIMPTFLKPAYEITENENFLGLPIYADNDYNQYEPEFQRVTYGTPSWMTKTSEGLNSLTGGDTHEKGWLEEALQDNKYARMLTNPGVWNHLLSGYLGGPYNLISQSVGVGTDLADGNGVKVGNIPIVSRFVARPMERETAGKLSDHYRDLLDEAEETRSHFNAYRKDYERAALNGDEDAMQEAREKMNRIMQGEDFIRSRIIEAYDGHVQKIRQLIRKTDDEESKARYNEILKRLEEQLREQLEPEPEEAEIKK